MDVRGFLLGMAVAFAAAAAPASAEVGASFSFPVARASHPLPLDASLSDPAWGAGLVPNGGAPWLNVTTRSPARQTTTTYLLYDDRNVYVGFKMEQTGVPIVATQTTNDVGFGLDDFVGIGIDTSGASSQAYYFETTPRGVRYEQANENVRYRPRWQAAAQMTADGWSAVMIIPLSVLRVPHAGRQDWRLQFVRAIAARGEHQVWAWSPLMQDGPAGTWPTFVDTRFWALGKNLNIAASSAARGRPRADVYGLESLGENRNVFEQANQTFLPESVRTAGIDVSLPLTPTLSFVGTLNPDFSNVEIDQQTIAPQEFQRQLLEYRPFFAQGGAFINALSGARTPAGAYTTANDLVFYSPDIGPFDSGAKVEGSYGDQSVGVLNFHGWDETTGNAFDDTAYGFEHALPRGTFIYWSDGVIANHSIAGSDTTIETGIEGRDLSKGFVWYFDHSFEDGTWVPQGHADLTQGFVDVHKANYEVNLGYFDVSPNYNPIDGYTPNSDIRGPQGYVNLTGTEPGVKSFGLFLGGDRFMDRSGAVHQADTQLFANVVFKNGFSFDGAGQLVGELRSYGIPSGPGCSGSIAYSSSFTGYPCYLDGVTSPFNLTIIPIGYRDGTPRPIDVTYEWGPFGSNYVHLFTAVTSRPIGRRMTLGAEYDGTYERAFADGSLSSQWLRRISLGYNFTSESSFTLALRDISGLGGFAPIAGNNLAVAYHQRFPNGNELFVNYGTPAAPTTLNRLIVKYIFHVGADAGT